jgi:N-acetylmuramoyl-L-alanine amidase
VVWHFTAGGGFRSNTNELSLPGKNKSAHFLIGRNVGEIINLVPLDKAAWHAGSKNNSSKFKGNPYVNAISIGIEIVNAGGLLKQGEKFFTCGGDWTDPYTVSNKIVENPWPVEVCAGTEVIRGWKKKDGTPAFPDGILTYWESFSDATIEMIRELALALLEKYPYLTRDCFVSHMYCDPTHKVDPGPLFPWDMIDEIFEAR